MEFKEENLSDAATQVSLKKAFGGKEAKKLWDAGMKIAEKDLDSIGDTSTLAEPEVVDDLVKNAPK